MATSTMPTATTSNISSPTSSCFSNDVTCGVPSPGTLYLFTFLATLLLLMIAAGSIISRSVYLRRRRQMIETGRQMAPNQKPRQPNFSRKPRIFDVYLSEAFAESELRHWESIMPFSVTFTTREGAPEPEPLNAVDVDAATAVPPESTRSRIFSRRRRVLRSTNTNLPPAEPLMMADPVLIPLSELVSSLCAEIAYIILLPAEHDAQSKSAEAGVDDAELPLFEFGMAEVDVGRSSGDEALLDQERDGKAGGLDL